MPVHVTVFLDEGMYTEHVILACAEPYLGSAHLLGLRLWPSEDPAVFLDLC